MPLRNAETADQRAAPTARRAVSQPFNNGTLARVVANDALHLGLGPEFCSGFSVSHLDGRLKNPISSSPASTLTRLPSLV